MVVLEASGSCFLDFPLLLLRRIVGWSERFLSIVFFANLLHCIFFICQAIQTLD
jgi:hypothetical protein